MTIALTSNPFAPFVMLDVAEKVKKLGLGENGNPFDNNKRLSPLEYVVYRAIMDTPYYYSNLDILG